MRSVVASTADFVELAVELAAHGAQEAGVILQSSLYVSAAAVCLSSWLSALSR